MGRLLSGECRLPQFHAANLPSAKKNTWPKHVGATPRKTIHFAVIQHDPTLVHKNIRYRCTDLGILRIEWGDLLLERRIAICQSKSAVELGKALGLHGSPVLPRLDVASSQHEKDSLWAGPDPMDELHLGFLLLFVSGCPKISRLHKVLIVGLCSSAPFQWVL